MNHELQKNEPTNARMTEVQFEAWPATGLLPNQFCFLHAYLAQHRVHAKETTDPVELHGKAMIRPN